MRKVISLAGTSTDARRTRLALALLVAAVATVGLLPWLGADAASPHGGGGHHGDGRNDKLLFFAADGLRQDIVERYADQRAVPGFRDLLRKGAKASGDGLLTQAPPEHGLRLVHAHHGRLVRRSRLDEQHLPRQRPGLRELDVVLRPRRAPGRDPRPVGRAWRQEGRPDRVGRRPQRRHRGADRRLPQLPLDARRGNELHRSGRRRGFHGLVRPPVRPPERLRGPRSVPAGRAIAGAAVGPTCRARTARHRRCACAGSTVRTPRGSTSTA